MAEDSNRLNQRTEEETLPSKASDEALEATAGARHWREPYLRSNTTVGKCISC
jgi:hypothetical protein